MVSQTREKKKQRRERERETLMEERENGGLGGVNVGLRVLSEVKLVICMAHD